MNIGIMQGRLSQPREGYQDCPFDWRREFAFLSKLGLSHIEWVVTKKSLNFNPCFHEVLVDYPIHTICADNLVDRRICDSTYMEKNLKPICETALRNGIKSVSIPLLEESSVIGAPMRKDFCSILKEYTEEYKELEFWIEAELEVSKLVKILSVSDNIFVTYDTGNITSCGFEHYDYLSSTYERVRNVHLKDRTFGAKTVPPLEGDTDFKKVFKFLKQKNYNGIYTIQTAREESGMEYQTIKKHKNILEELYDEQSI